ncbi:MAG: D-tyrosyl-tRNA(Tyr) deacylase [candidate division NC10 bacterium]|nr:D-tyrosyl-tRNA(Tyr) deacylase [candidate division NC10 bacterium]
MRAVLQRVREASVSLDGREVAAIGPGLLVLLGVGQADTAEAARWLAGKVADLRIFEDTEGKMNRSVREAGGAVLVVSQFTLYADARKGRRPSFTGAAPPEAAVPLVRAFVEELEGRGLPVQEGVFGARMQVRLVNDGPVTILLDTAER